MWIQETVCMSKTISFSSIDEARNQGYVLATVQQYQRYKGCSIFGYDRHQRGFAESNFGLRVEIPEEYTPNYLGTRSDRIFGKAVTVAVQSKFGSDGRVVKVQMFEPHEFRIALEMARDWTNEWFRAHPEALRLHGSTLRPNKSTLAGFAKAVTG